MGSIKCVQGQAEGSRGLSGNWTCCIYVFSLNFYFLMHFRNFLLCFSSTNLFSIAHSLI